MTKQEWINELKKHISELSSAEQEKIVEFYEELFADRIESGKSEEQIIDEFGSPSVAAATLTTGESEQKPKVLQKVETPDFWAGRGGKKKVETPKVETPKAEMPEEPRAVPLEMPKEATQHKEPKAPQRKERSTAKSVLLGVEIVIFGFVFAALIIVVWSLIFSAIAVGFSLGVGAVYAAICAVMPSLTLGVRIVEIAVALLCVAIALAVIPNTGKIFKGGATISKGIYKVFFGWY